MGCDSRGVDEQAISNVRQFRDEIVMPSERMVSVRRYLLPAALSMSLILMMTILVGCAFTERGEGYEIANQRMEVIPSGTDAHVTIKGTLVNTLKEEETPVVVYSILDGGGKRIAVAIHLAENMPAGSRVDFETSLIPILPGKEEVKADDYEIDYATVIGLMNSMVGGNKEQLTKKWLEVCQAAKSYKLEAVFFAKAELRKVQREADEIVKKVEQEKATGSSSSR